MATASYRWPLRKTPLTDEEVQEIRKGFQSGQTKYALARHYQVCWKTIKNAVDYRVRYANIP